mmetsp:Transcript_2944/g.2414  ORF Transcript_2944/g.2414 Transcript_2944/m.2414 type:complete len:84 (+) Transcript_2944:84-335(+)
MTSCWYRHHHPREMDLLERNRAWLCRCNRNEAVLMWNIEVFITLYLSYAPPDDLPLAGQSSGTAVFTVITVVGGGTIAFTMRM